MKQFDSMRRSRQRAAAAAMALMAFGVWGRPGAAADDTLRIGVREDAAPFSVKWKQDGEEAGTEAEGADYYGYSVELCVDFARKEGLDFTFVEVDTGDRFHKLATEGDAGIDILCGATTATLNVMKLFDVSFYTFLTATSYLVGPGIDRKIGEGAGMIVIGYRENTTSVPTDKIGRDDLREKFSTLLDTPTNKFAFRKITNHKDAVPALLGDRDREAIDLYIGDRPILASLREWEIAATLRKKEAVRSELRAVDKNLSAAKQSLEQAQSAKKGVEEAESEVEAASAEVSAIEDKLNALTERERILKEGLIVSTDVLNIQPYALILPKCSRHLFRLNQFLAAKFRDPAFIEKWKGRFGYDFDVAMEKIIEFQTSIPVGSVIQVDEPTCKQPG